jgi:N6-adenosine-specific RNA methylase IME4
MTYEIHEAANAFPMLAKQELKELAKDIKANGLQVPVCLYQDKVIDGRNRLAACRIAGVMPHYTRPEIADPYMWVWSINGERRHLASQEQKAIIWDTLHGMSEAMVAERARIKREADKARSEAAKGHEDRGNQHKVVASSGTDCTTSSTTQEQRAIEWRDTHAEPPKPKQHATRKAEAKAAGVNTGAMARAKALRSASPELAQKVASGEMKYTEAKREVRREEIKVRIEEIESAPTPETVDGPFDLVLADPPWRYDFSETKQRDIENHYPTATVDDICKHAPDTNKDAILLLWATAPKLLEAIKVMDAWGFSYKTQAVWDKQKIGMGYWFRGQHEILIVATKGKVSPPPDFARVGSVFSEARSQHSKKPECVYKWIERAFSDKKKLEMYCRKPRAGWGVWGNEV